DDPQHAEELRGEPLPPRDDLVVGHGGTSLQSTLPRLRAPPLSSRADGPPPRNADLRRGVPRLRLVPSGRRLEPERPLRDGARDRREAGRRDRRLPDLSRERVTGTARA